MHFEFGIYRLEVDPERTRLFYETDDSEYFCDCSGCRNFFQAVRLLPESVQEVFRRLGVDISKPADMTAYVSQDGNLTYYDGFYHICGTIIDGKNPWLQVSERGFRLDESCLFAPSPGYALFFTEKCALVDGNFPRPVIQLEVQWQLPWLLEEPNPYYFP